MLLFLATEKGYKVLETVYKYNKSIIGIVSTFKEVNVKDSFSDRIKGFCIKNNLTFIHWNDLKNSLFNDIIKYQITCAIAIGWRYIIPLEINNYLKTDLIIFHDSLLPRFRGFSPTPTAILCDEKEIGMSVLYATKYIDRGPIIIQKKFTLTNEMYIYDVIQVQTRLYCDAIIEVIRMIENRNISIFIQDESKATYSIWRDIDDCHIDWNFSSKAIYNLIRAVGYPFTGAFAYYNDKKVFVWKAEIAEDLVFEKRDVGKIWSIDEKDNPTVVCGAGMLKLTNVTDENNNKVLFNYLRKRFN